MLTGIEFIFALAAIAGGIAMFVIASRRRPAAGLVPTDDASTGGIMKTNLYALAVIAMIFFGAAFLVDVFS